MRINLWNIPLLDKEEWLRGQEKTPKATLARSDGVVGWAPGTAELTTPSAPSAVASQHFLDGAATPAP